jgi:hypothetical protein
MNNLEKAKPEERLSVVNCQFYIVKQFTIYS